MDSDTPMPMDSDTPMDPTQPTPADDFANQPPSQDVQAPAAPPASTGQAAVALAGTGALPAGVSGIGDFFSFNAFDFTLQTVAGPGGGSFPPGTVLSEQRLFSPASINRSFKIVENQRPQPVDRVFINTNYFSDVDGAGTDFYRYSIGGEKTFANDQASLLVFVPFYTLNPGDLGGLGGSDTLGFGGGSDTEVGDVTAALKYVLWSDYCSHQILTGGAAVTIPTGPDTIGDVDRLVDTGIDNNGSIQPFLIYAKAFDSGAYIQGYTGLDVAFDSDAPAFWFNSISTGYVMNTGGCWCSAIIPKAEIHVNTPIANDSVNVTPTSFARSLAPPGSILSVTNTDIPDTVNFTYGITAVLCGCSELTVAGTTPLTGNELFDYEVQVQYSLICR